MITDKKQHDRIPIKQKIKMLENDKKLPVNDRDKTQIKLRCIKNEWQKTIQDST